METTIPRRRTPLSVKLLLAAIVAVAGVVAIPGFLEGRRVAAAADCMKNLPRLYKSISLYQADNSGFLPPDNPNRTEYWRVTCGELTPNPLLKYDPKLATAQCPQDGHGYTLRFAVPIRARFDESVRPDEIRVIDPEPGTVLAECHGHLEAGYSHKPFSTASTYAALVPNRRGFHQVLRGDGSVGRIDARKVRQLSWMPGEAWMDSPPRTDRGTPWELFPGEPWPLKWALRYRP